MCLAVLLLAAGALIASGVASAAAPLVLSGATAFHTWDGHGGLSAGGSSRLLRDYSEPYRSDILDLLYKPSFGAALKICKIEIGGDVMSTDGAEASHMHSRDDLSCGRGYELWLAREALARNPNITTFALSWGVPGFVGNGTFFSDENMRYQAAFATCFLQEVGRPLDLIGIWNERAWGGTDYVVRLRAALDAAGHAHTRIVLPDNAVASDAELMSAMVSNATFGAAFAVAGSHRGPVPAPAVQASGHRYWASETGTYPIFGSNDWRAARDWAQQLNRYYLEANMTAAVSWATIWAVLPGLPYEGRGFMLATSPWSGAYNASAPLWVAAHHGQFAEPGWRYLLAGVPGGSGVLPPGDAGSYIALVPPDSLAELTIIVESIGANASTRVFALGGGLPGAGTAFVVWTTTDAARFVRQPDAVVAADGTLTLTVPADGVLTASTVRTAAHGAPVARAPPPAPLPLPYRDSFNEADCAYDALPRYLSDQGGAFACRNGSLAQVVTMRPGANDWYTTPDPITLLGDAAPWGADVAVGATVTIAPAAPARRVGATDDPNAAVAACEAAPGPLSAQVWRLDEPYTGYVSNSVGSDSTCLNLYGCLPRLIYYECCAACGCYDSAGFRFQLRADATLSAPLLPGLCAAVLADGATVSMVACDAAAPSQQWTHAPSGQLVNTGARACLTSQLLPPYARVCARVTSYSGFDGFAPVPGYCLRVGGDGAWVVSAGNETLAKGSLAGGGFDAAAPIPLVLTVRGDSVAAAAAGRALGAWPGRGRFANGLVALGSGVHAATFDDFFVEAS
jgi:hypothetical protein